MWRHRPASAQDFARQRARMVAQQLAARGISDPAVLAAFRAVPREAFVPPEQRQDAYRDSPLPIGESQTISQPFVVALMVEALEISGGDRVLEIGTGSGYAAAILSQVAAEVYTVERHPSLAREAERRCAELGYRNVHIRVGDGTLGWPEHAPYDAIVVSAAAPEVPEPLAEQLAVAGKLVIPVGASPYTQELLRLTRTGPETLVRENLGGVAFVPLVGAEGWQDR